jgi:hypothetical protein
MSRKAHNRGKTVVSDYAGFAFPVQNMHATVHARRRPKNENPSQIRWVNTKSGSWHFNCSWGTHTAPITIGAD